MNIGAGENSLDGFRNGKLMHNHGFGVIAGERVFYEIASDEYMTGVIHPIPMITSEVRLNDVRTDTYLLAQFALSRSRGILLLVNLPTDQLSNLRFPDGAVLVEDQNRVVCREGQNVDRVERVYPARLLPPPIGKCDILKGNTPAMLCIEFLRRKGGIDHAIIRIGRATFSDKTITIEFPWI